MRVDSQLDDKNMREKMKLMKSYSPLDFGVEPEFSTMLQTTKVVEVEDLD